MSLSEIVCPACGETDELVGQRRDTEIDLTCERCGQRWTRETAPHCAKCGGDDIQDVPVAIVEKSRGTQLSVVGIRTVDMCWQCDRDTIDRWQANRPNPLLPGELPNADHGE